MLTKKLYQQVGLVNGIRGQVVELVFADDGPRRTSPFTLSSSSEGTQGGNDRLRRYIEGVCRFIPYTLLGRTGERRSGRNCR